MTIVEFSDFQCPYCARVQSLITTLQRKYKNDLNITFKHFPISGHRDAEWFARLAEYARRGGHFWEVHDFLFSRQSDLSRNDALAFSRTVGMTEAQTTTCVASTEVSDKVAQDKQDGLSIGVTGTPTFLINGRLVLSGQSLSVIVDQESQRRASSAGQILKGSSNEDKQEKK